VPYCETLWFSTSPILVEHACLTQIRCDRLYANSEGQIVAVLLLMVASRQAGGVHLSVEVRSHEAKQTLWLWQQHEHIFSVILHSFFSATVRTDIRRDQRAY